MNLFMTGFRQVAISLRPVQLYMENNCHKIGFEVTFFSSQTRESHTRDYFLKDDLLSCFAVSQGFFDF